MRQPSDRLERDELFRLHEQYLTEMRTSLDLAHRNLSFYVGLLSAILVALLAGLLNLHVGDPRGRWLIAGPALVFCLAEVGYSTVRVFYHRFLDAYFTLLNIEHMLKLDQARWLSIGVTSPLVPSRSGGFIAQWTGAVDWLVGCGESNIEDVKAKAMERRLVTPMEI